MRKELYFEITCDKYHYTVWNGYTPEEAINKCFRAHEEARASGLINYALDKSKLKATLNKSFRAKKFNRD